jgi:hypothetical protein
MIKVYRNGSNYSSNVQWESLRFEEVATKEVDTASFSVLNYQGKVLAEVHDEIIIEVDGIRQFGGVIVERNQVIDGGVLVRYDYQCKDFSQFLDKVLVVESYSNMSAHEIVADLITNYAPGFTFKNVAMMSPVVGSIKFNYELLSRSLTQLAELVGWEWYVDPYKDIHFFRSESNNAPFNLDDTSGNFEWATLSIVEDIKNIKNSIFVRGGERKNNLTQATAVDKYVADGVKKTFSLAYRYQNIQVRLNTALQGVGIDNITDPMTVQVLYNFNEKFIRFTSIPPKDATVTVYGDALIPIIINLQDGASIAKYGAYEDVIIDKSITTVVEAMTRAQVELDQYAASSFEASFKTLKTGLHTGQYIKINSVIRNINKSFRIGRIAAVARGSDHFEYTVSLRTYGAVTFNDLMIDLLTKDKKNLQLSDDEVLQVIKTLTDTFSIADSSPTGSFTKAPYKWGMAMNALKWNLGTWS